MATAWDESDYWRAQVGGANRQIMADDFRKMLGPLISVLDDDTVSSLAAGKSQAQRDKEEVFERVRREVQSDAPSRSSAMFLCESEEQLRTYISTFAFPIEGKRIIEVQTVVYLDDVLPEAISAWALEPDLVRDLNECRRFRANPRFLNCNTGDWAYHARRYWAGEDCDPLELTEILFRGFFRVTRIISV